MLYWDDVDRNALPARGQKVLDCIEDNGFCFCQFDDGPDDYALREQLIDVLGAVGIEYFVHPRGGQSCLVFCDTDEVER